ncbi:MAG TPA: B12-binding domain-containing radical SAM protein [Candidatus Hypogeohydataceae bacterium YC38]
MKVLLITPPTKHMIPIVEPKLVMEEVGFYPPLGLMYLASFLEKETQHEVSIIDSVVEGLDYPALEAKIKEFEPDLVGIQSFTQTLVDAVKVAEMVKAIDKDIHVCMGGTHATLYPQETIALPHVDTAIVGEGETSFTHLVESLSKDQDLSQVSGLLFKKNGHVARNEPKPYTKELDRLPFPARHLTPVEKYYSIIEADSPMTTMISTRGCPYNCIFCLGSVERTLYRERTPGNVVDEMEQCVKEGFKDIFFWDSIFTINKRRVMSICQEIQERGLKITWSVRSRIDQTDEEMLQKMRAAGCRRIQYGIESGSNRTLSSLRKGISLKQISEGVARVKSLGFTVYGDFMVGSPGETREDVINTINFAIALDLDYVNFSVVTPYSHTELYDLGFKKGLYNKDYWKEFAKNPKEGFVPEVWEENLSREELNELLTTAYRSFYLRPRYILKRVLEVRSAQDLWRKARTGIKMLQKKTLEL